VPWADGSMQRNLVRNWGRLFGNQDGPRFWGQGMKDPAGFEFANWTGRFR
jgi:hypothetical protein